MSQALRCIFDNFLSCEFGFETAPASATLSPMAPDELMRLAGVASASAYAPYSQARVGCALVSATGTVYQGCNVENASYGLTICAERNAIISGVAKEGATFRIAQLAVVAPGLEFAPCGACRQVMQEFADPQLPISFLRNGRLVTVCLQELLPYGFSFEPS